jgi:AraC-like DNA-binding protein
MSTKPRPPAPWFRGWEHPLPEIPSLVHFNEAQAPPLHRLPPHRHPSFELCLIVGGCAHWTNPDGTYVVRPGDLYVTLPDEVHEGYADEAEPQHNFAIGFDLRLATPRLDDQARAADEARAVDAILPRQRVIPGGLPTERIFRALGAELGAMPAAGDPRRPLAIAMVQALMVELAVTATRIAIAARAPLKLPAAAPDLTPVVERMRAALADAPTLAEMAGWAGLSPGHFAVVFKRAYGSTPLEYLTALRIDAAAERLRADPRAAVTDVALSLGFCSSQYFSEVFKRVKGTTPSQWRGG